MRKVIWLQTVTLFCLGGGIISLSCWMCLRLVILGRQKYTQQNHSCLSWVSLRLKWLLKNKKDRNHQVLVKSQQNWWKQHVELFAVRSTNLTILFGIRRNCLRSGRSQSLHRGPDKSLARPGRKQAHVSVRMAWISFDTLPCRKKKLDDGSCLDDVIAHIPDMLLNLFPSGAG